jgi:hypothetical protein
MRADSPCAHVKQVRAVAGGSEREQIVAVAGKQLVAGPPHGLPPMGSGAQYPVESGADVRYSAA